MISMDKMSAAAVAVLCGIAVGTDAMSREPEAAQPRASVARAAVEQHVDCQAAGSAVLGTSRVIEITPASTPLHVGLKTYPQTLDLEDHEVVLTFDDGPSPDTTKAVLAALAKECVKATFFLIGRNAKDHPDLVKRELDEGHTIGYHSNTHPSVTLRGMTDQAGLADIDAGIAAVEQAGHRNAPTVRFFRFPGFADSPFLLSKLDGRGVAVFGADLWAADWLKMTPAFELARVMTFLDDPKRRGGIILFHDTKASTAAMLPDFFRALKANGYKIVHLQSREGTAPVPLRQAPAGWTSETERIIAHVWPRIMPGAKHALAPERTEPLEDQTSAEPR